MNKLTPQEAWQRISATSTQRKAKGTQAMPEMLMVKDGVYVFSQDGSATITTAYEELPVILGQWDEGDGVMPDALVDMIQSYSKQVKWWEENPQQQSTKARRAAKAASTKIDIPVMLKSKWGQYAPFNDNNPTGCPCGCVALAVAQVMWHYREYKRGCTAITAYKTATNKTKIAALPNVACFDYKNMTDNKPTTKKGKAAVAQLLQYIGAALRSDYRTDGTSAKLSQAYHVLEDNIRLCTKMGYEYESSGVDGVDRFFNKVYNSLKNGSPVIMRGDNHGKGGHCFIIDGYSAAKNLFHVNWGWYGQYDGWFALSALTPYNKNYSTNKAAITNIKPYILGDINCDGKVTIQDVMEEVKVINNGKTDTNDINYDVNYDGVVDVNDANAITKIILEK